MKEAVRIRDMLAAKGLVALNSFGNRVRTYVRPKGSSFIDFVMVRRPVADNISKRSCVVKAPMASWRTVGHGPVVTGVHGCARSAAARLRRQRRARASRLLFHHLNGGGLHEPKPF